MDGLPSVAHRRGGRWRPLVPDFRAHRPAITGWEPANLGVPRRLTVGGAIP